MLGDEVKTPQDIAEWVIYVTLKGCEIQDIGGE